MSGTRHQFPPDVTMEKPRDRAVINLMSDPFLKSLLDVSYRDNRSLLCMCKERGEELLLFIRCEMATMATFAWRFYGSRSPAIVARDDVMNGRGGNPTVPSDVFGLAWINQGMVDHQPELSPPGA